MKPDLHAPAPSAKDSSNENVRRDNDAAPTARASLLGPTVVLKGSLSFGEPLVVLGQIHGSVTGTGAVLIKRNARISGDVSATSIELEKGAAVKDVVLTGRIQQTRAKK